MRKTDLSAPTTNRLTPEQSHKPHVPGTLESLSNYYCTRDDVIKGFEFHQHQQHRSILTQLGDYKLM